MACQKEEVKTQSVQKSDKYDFAKKVNSHSQKLTDDFSDLKKKEDEACDTEEEITKKLAKPKQEVFQLQGGDSGCDVEGEEKSH